MPELHARVDARVLDALDGLVRTSGAPRDHLVERALAEYLGVEHHTLYQVSTAGALVEGVYQGAVSVGMVREHGDFGLGTFEDLDGEMVVLDGHVFRVSSSGTSCTSPVDDTRNTWPSSTTISPSRSSKVPRPKSPCSRSTPTDTAPW